MPCLTERCRCPDQGVGPLDPELRREPPLLQNTQLSPLRRREIMLRRKMLSQRRQQHVSSLVTSTWRLGAQQRGLHPAWLPAILLQELPDEFPLRPVISRS